LFKSVRFIRKKFIKREFH